MFVTFVPIGVTVKICAVPVRALLKAIFVPSGDQVGWKSVPSNVIRFGLVPSLFTTQMPPLALKAIFVPSGEKAGKLWPVVGTSGWVSRIPASMSKETKLTCVEVLT